MLLELGRHSFDVSTHAIVMARQAEPGADAAVLFGSGQGLLDRVGEIANRCDLPVACAATNTESARALLTQGASVIDGGALTDPMLLPEIAEAGASVWIHHPSATADVVAFLAERARWAQAAGIAPSRIIVEAPLDRIKEIGALGYPVLVSIEEDELARGREVTAAMDGARVIVSSVAQTTRRTIFTVGELLSRRAVAAPNAVERAGVR